MVSSDVPPAEIVPGVNVLLTIGDDGVTVSMSAAEQTPAVQETDGLVLVTLAGGVIDAVLVI